MLGIYMGVSVGDEFMCTLRSDNIVQCLEENTRNQRTVPDGLGSGKSISARTAHTCAIKADDIVQCWGNHSSGQLIVSVEFQ